MQKLLVSILLLSTLLGYMEWGNEMHAFVFQVELILLSKILKEPQNLIHPFILFPLAGQLFLLISLFQNKLAKTFTFIGIACVSLLFTLLLLIGIMSANLKILLSVLPFYLLAVLIIYRLRPASTAND